MVRSIFDTNGIPYLLIGSWLNIVVPVVKGYTESHYYTISQLAYTIHTHFSKCREWNFKETISKSIVNWSALEKWKNTS